MSGWTAMPNLDTITGLEVVVSPVLPAPPSDREQARRIVRHGYADAGMWAKTLGDVGPRPGVPTRALLAGRQLIVDRLLAEEIRDALTRRREQAEARKRRAAQQRADLQAIATSLGVRHVSAVREPDYGRTTYRAHLEAEGELADTVDVRFEDHELVRHPNTTAVIAAVAHSLRRALVERKLDEEQAARGGY